MSFSEAKDEDIVLVDIESAAHIPSRIAAPALNSSRVVERLNSINVVRGPSKIRPSAKLPGEFRTLRFVFVNCLCKVTH